MKWRYFIICLLVILIAFTGLKFLKVKNMKIESTSFENNSAIPAKYTCDGKDINPELRIIDVPDGTQELVLIVDDPDAPGGIWTHWTVWGISPDIDVIKEGVLPDGAVEGVTSFGTIGYGGPCPPEGTGVHRYFFRLYALNKKIDLPAASTTEELKEKIEGSIIEEADIIGLYTHDK